MQSLDNRRWFSSVLVKIFGFTVANDADKIKSHKLPTLAALFS